MALRVLAIELAIVSLTVGLTAAPTLAQRPDANQVAINVLRRLDANGDGNLDASEIPERSREAVTKIATEAGLNPSKTLSIEKLVKQLEKAKKKEQKKKRKQEKSDSREGEERKSREDRAKPRSSRDDRRNEKPEEPSKKTPGFGATVKTSTSAKGFGASNSQASSQGKDQSLVRYVDRMMGRYDKNKNGYLDRTEWKDVRWSDEPQQYDKNSDGRLSKNELYHRYEKQFSKKRESKTSTSSTSSEKINTSASRQSDDRVKRYAEGLMRRYDRDKSGYLEQKRGEWDRLRGDPKKFDRNRDHVLNINELTSLLKGYSNSSNSSSSSKQASNRSSKYDRKKERERSKGRDDDRKVSSEDRKSYRFLTAHERLPDDLPDFFVEKDKDQDGQIMMSEFAATWSEYKVQQFTKYDLNNDGILVPEEVLAVEEDDD